MDWNELRRIDREVIGPQVDAWACDTREARGPSLAEALGVLPNIRIERIIEGVIQSTISDSLTGVTGPLLAAGADRRLLRFLGALLWARVDHERATKRGNPLTQAGVEAAMAAIASFGPLDRLDGTGPGKPVAAHRDEQGRLHNAAGPAMEFRDGRRVYALSGVYIGLGAWEARDDASQIIREPNAEVRRTLMQRYGLTRFLVDARMTPVQSDRFGTLYRLEHEGYVHVRCPSTGQDYVLAVPARCETAHEAVAWTFGMVPEDYDPQQET